MKSFNVKSNAKRLARKLALAHPGYIADEPVEVTPGSREWFPNLGAPNATIAAGVPAEIRDVAYVNGKPVEVEPAKAEPIEEPAPAPAAKDTMALAADLPPPVRSSAEDIAARRAERLARIDREKAEGTRTAAGVPVKPERKSKSDTIVELVSRPEGATKSELEAATGWQAHTLRGYIAGTLRKRGHAIEAIKIKGEETRYIIRQEGA